jgi:O-antigen/teichoic acid export membrane protein
MFWRGVLGYLPVQVVQGLSGLGAIVVFTRLLSPADYGAYALGFSAFTLVGTCAFVWLESAMARFFAAEAEGPDRAALFATVYRTFAVLSVVAPAAAIAFALGAPAPAGVRWAVAAGVGSTMTRSLLKLSQERRRAAGEVRGYALLDMAQTLGAFALGALGALAGLGGAAPLLGSGVMSLVLVALTLPGELKRGRGGRWERARLGRYAAYGVPISLSLVLALVLATTDRFVLAVFSDEATVGAYHAGYSLSNRTLDVLFIWLGMAGAPAAVAAFERGGVEALRRTAAEQASLMALLALPAAAGLALTARPLAQVMVGPALRAGAATVTPWIALSGLLGGATTYYFHTAFTLGRRTGRLLAVMGLAAGANVALNLVLTPRMGLRGAVIATAISYALGLVASAVLGRRVLALPIPWSAIGRAGLATALMATAVLRVPPLGGVVELGLKAAVGAAAYALAAFALDAGGLRSRGPGLLRAAVARPA